MNKAVERIKQEFPTLFISFHFNNKKKWKNVFDEDILWTDQNQQEASAAQKMPAWVVTHTIKLSLRTEQSLCDVQTAAKLLTEPCVDETLSSVFLNVLGV